MNWWLFFAAVAFMWVLAWSIRNSPRMREKTRTGWVREAQRSSENPWRQSLRYAWLAGLVVMASVGSVTDGALGFWLTAATGVGVAIAWPFFYRFWLGPYIARRYLYRGRGTGSV
jgi:hypothetical protein